MKSLLRIIVPLTLVIGLWYLMRFISGSIDQWIRYLSYTIFFGILILVIFGIVQLMRWMKRCDKCGAWGAIREVGRKEINKEQSTKIKTLKTKDKVSKVTQTKKVAVPATKYTYLVEKKCKSCGNKSQDKITKIVEN